MSDFAKFIPQKVTYSKLHSPAIECKEGLALCISRLVEFELLFELKFEPKKGTSLVKLVLSLRQDLKQYSICPLQ
jgi:hypothetical protein